MKPEVAKLINLRPAEDTDYNFIFATWLRGVYYGNSLNTLVDKDEFMERYTQVINNLLFKPSVSVQAACLKEDADTLVGYAVIEKFNVPHGTIIHWAYVKPRWRKQGIASALVPDDVTGFTAVVDSIINLKLKAEAKSSRWLSDYDVKLRSKKLKYKPFLL